MYYICTVPVCDTHRVRDVRPQRNNFERFVFFSFFLSHHNDKTLVPVISIDDVKSRLSAQQMSALDELCTRTTCASNTHGDRYRYIWARAGPAPAGLRAVSASPGRLAWTPVALRPGARLTRARGERIR